MFKVKMLHKAAFIWQHFNDKNEVIEESAVFTDKDECQKEMNERNAWLISKGIQPESVQTREEVAASGVDVEKVEAEAVTEEEAEKEVKPKAKKKAAPKKKVKVKK